MFHYLSPLTRVWNRMSFIPCNKEKRIKDRDWLIDWPMHVNVQDWTESSFKAVCTRQASGELAAHFSGFRRALIPCRKKTRRPRALFSSRDAKAGRKMQPTKGSDNDRCWHFCWRYSRCMARLSPDGEQTGLQAFRGMKCMSERTGTGCMPATPIAIHGCAHLRAPCMCRSGWSWWIHCCGMCIQYWLRTGYNTGLPPPLYIQDKSPQH